MTDSSVDPIIVRLTVDCLDGSITVQADDPPENLWLLLRDAADQLKPRGSRGRPRRTDGFEIDRLAFATAEVERHGLELGPAEIAWAYGADVRSLVRWVGGRRFSLGDIVVIYRAGKANQDRAHATHDGHPARTGSSRADSLRTSRAATDPVAGSSPDSGGTRTPRAASDGTAGNAADHTNSRPWLTR